APRLAAEGAHITCVDLDKASAQSAADAIVAKQGAGIGVAGTGISGCGPAIGVAANMIDRASIRAALDETILAYGGIDDVVVTAGVFIPPDTSGRITDDQWAKTFAVNVTGAYLVADEAAK